jgi:hypothetical protein
MSACHLQGHFWSNDKALLRISWIDGIDAWPEGNGIDWSTTSSSKK